MVSAQPPPHLNKIELEQRQECTKTSLWTENQEQVAYRCLGGKRGTPHMEKV